MFNNPTYPLKPTFNAPKNRVVLWTLVALTVVVFAAVITLSASANPPNAAEVRIQGWVSQLQEDRLTAQRHNAQRELENAGEAAVPALMVALRSDNSVLRRNAADMLGFIASPRATAGLQYTLANDTMPSVRRNAAYALGELNSFAAIADLQRASVLDTNALVRQTSQDSLARVRSRIALSAGINELNLNAYAVAPSNADTLYAAAGRDMHVTYDGGKTWGTWNSTLPSLTDQLAVSPSNPLILYAAVDSLGMYKSVDGGRHWASINTGLNAAPGVRTVISAITIDPTDAERVLIATGVMLGTGNVEFVPTGIARSTDGGATWNLILASRQGQALTQMSLKGNQVYALAGQRVMVYRLD